MSISYMDLVILSHNIYQEYQYFHAPFCYCIHTCVYNWSTNSVTYFPSCKETISSHIDVLYGYMIYLIFKTSKNLINNHKKFLKLCKDRRQKIENLQFDNSLCSIMRNKYWQMKYQASSKSLRIISFCGISYDS